MGSEMCIRDRYTLRELSSILKIDIPTLSRYTTGKLIPSIKRIDEIIPKLLELINPFEELKSSLISGVYNFPETNNILASRPHLLLWCAVQAVKHLSVRNFDAILTVEGGGLALASYVGFLMGKRIVYGIRNAYMAGGVSEPYSMSEVYIYDPRIRRYITIPEKAIARGEDIVIIDDISWTGGTVSALYRLAIRFKANVKTVYLIALFKNTYKLLSRSVKAPIEYLVMLEHPHSNAL